MTPASESLLAFTIIMNFMLFALSFSLQRLAAKFAPGFPSTYTSNESWKIDRAKRIFEEF
jgi:hypothetical protein